MDTFLTIFTSLLAYFNAPAIALFVMFVGAYFVLEKAQQRPDFDLGNMLKNSDGKESIAALGTLVAIILSGWALVYDTFKNGQVDIEVYAAFLIVWSGTKVAEKLVDALNAKWGGKPSTMESSRQE